MESTRCTMLRRRCNIGPETAQNRPISPEKPPKTASTASAASAGLDGFSGFNGFSGFSGFNGFSGFSGSGQLQRLPALSAAGSAASWRLRHTEPLAHVCRLAQICLLGFSAQPLCVAGDHADFEIDRHDSSLTKKQCDPQDFPCNRNQCGV